MEVGECVRRPCVTREESTRDAIDYDGDEHMMGGRGTKKKRIDNKQRNNRLDNFARPFPFLSLVPAQSSSPELVAGESSPAAPRSGDDLSDV